MKKIAILTVFALTSVMAFALDTTTPPVPKVNVDAPKNSIPVKDEDAGPGMATAPGGALDTAKTMANKANEKMTVNLNTASFDDLKKVPGIGEARAKAIIDHRPYKSVQDLSKIKGFKEGLIAKIKPYVTAQ